MAFHQIDKCLFEQGGVASHTQSVQSLMMLQECCTKARGMSRGQFCFFANLSVLVLLALPTIDAVPCNCDHTDIRAALLAFYNATSQGNTTWRTPWDASLPACYWSGVHCGGESFVISLQFDNVGMNGTFPTAALGGLKALQTLSISNEPHLVGTLPTVMATFASLVQLTLSNVNLVGTVPSFLASMSLTNVVLSNAGFNGTVPDLGGSTSLVALQLSSMPLLIGPALQFPQSLEYLCLTFLQPHATFPRAIFALRALRTLEITSVVVNSSLPNDISNLLNLERLTVSSNQLIGTLPLALCSLSSLVYLSLYGNGFGGFLPSFVGNLSSTLVELDIHDSAFQGTLPDELSLLGNLKTLRASYNAFSGSFPASWGRMTSLTYLDLSFNALSGTLPDAIGNITALTQLLLAGNRLSGSVDALMTLSNLVNLQLYYNSFGGAIPFSLSNLTQLKHLLLNGNTFSDTLPDVFDKIPQLVTLLAQQIGLAALPPSFASLSNLLTLDVSFNRITSMTTLLCNLSQVQWLDLSGNALVEVPRCMANLTAIVSLKMNYCRMKGNLSFIANMTALTTFGAAGNGFSGQLPDFDGLPHLAFFDVAQNNIFGTLPQTLANATNLTSLVVESNQLNGSIPQFMFQLQVFRAKNNMLNGGLPFTTNFSAIATIDLAYNAISGTFSEGIRSMSSLQSLDVSGNEISGTLPDCFDSLKSLRTFNAFGNRLSGSLPRSLFNVSTLQYLMLSSNHFGGTLPAVACHPATHLSNQSPTDVNNSESDATVCPANLATLSIAANLLTGELPSSMFNLSALSSLDLSHNKLSGSITIPAEWSMSLLSTLILSSNALDGETSFLSALSLLARVDLSHNKFSGTLSLGALHALQWVDASWNKLDGLGQWPTASLTSLKFCDVSYNNKLFDRLPSLDVAPQLATFLADGNGMLGSVPQAVPLSLATLSLGANLLMGSVPFASYHNLQFLNLAGNLLTGDLCCAFLNRTFAFGTLLLNINSFSGSLPSDFSGLSQLVKFDVSQNSITGSVPSSLLQLQMLQTLNLAKNQLSGTLARFIGGVFGQLASLNLSHNLLSGELPRTIRSSSLGTLSLEVNQFVNTLPSPWASMTHLTVLRIGSNSLNGTLPPSWSSLTQLQTLRMEANSISGKLSQFSAFSSLVELSLSGNRFSGVVPPDWDAALPSLRTLYLDSNAVNGTLPPSLGNLSSLAVLSLGSNLLTGSVPALWADASVWPSLSTFDIGSNFLSGTLPVGLVSGATNLTVLNAASNSLTGTLPYEWFAFSSLQLLNASRNPIRGSLPRSWALLNSLETMDLSQTSLSGALPANWGDDGSLISLANFLLSGSFCFKLPLSWMRRGALNSSVSQISSNNCSYSRSSAASLSAAVTVTKATASTTQSLNDSNSFTSTRDGSLSTTLAASTSLRTTPSSKSFTGMSFNYTPWQTPSVSVILQITLSHGKAPTNTSSRTSKVTATKISSRSENTLNPTSSLSRSLTASVVQQTLSASLHRTSTVDIVLTPSNSLSASRVLPQIVPTAAFSTRGLSTTVVSAGIVASMLSNGLTSTVSLLQIGQSTRQMLFAACRNSSEPTSVFDDWMDNPLQIRLSQMPPMLQSAGGAVVGNTVLMLALLAVRCGLSIGRTLCDGLSLQQWGLSHVLARWPSCTSISLEPTISAAVYIIASPYRSSASVALGICLGGAMVLSIILVHWRLMILCGNAEVKVVPTPPVVSQVPRRLLTWSNHLSGWWRWFVRDQWAWIAVGPNRLQFEVFRDLVRSSRSTACVHAAGLDVTWTIVCAVLLGAGFVSSGNCALCRRLSWVLFAWSLMRVVLCVWVRPMSSRVDNVELVIMSVTNSLLMLLAIVDASDGAGATMEYIELAVLMVKVAGQIVSRFLALVDQRRETSSRVDRTRNGRLTEGQRQQLEHLVRFICHTERLL